MTVFIDTSALFAALDRRDEEYDSARRRWTELLTSDEDLLTTSYVVLETVALLQRRLGLDAVRLFQTRFVPAVRIHWVHERLHGRGMSILLAAGLRGLSLVDCVSFEVMRDLGLDTAFVYDTHFEQQGFRCLH